jgi:endonuclease YncB( thermonuclease family)
MSRLWIPLIVTLAVFAAACDTRPQAPEFQTTTSSTSTTLPGGSATPTTTPPLPPPDERVVGSVSGVTDGDTMTVLIDGSETVVRLLGVNAPELTECWGPESGSALTDLVLGRDVVLIEDDEPTDGFGRALRFVLIVEGDAVEFVNARLVADGHAVAIQNGNPYASMMKQSEARAFQSGKGMWGTFACGSGEGITTDRPVVRVAELNYDPPGPDDAALDQEYIVIENQGYARVPIDLWVLRDESSTNRLTFPRGTTIEVGGTITVVTGCTGGPPGAIHWCSDTPVWSNGGDTAIVMDSLGNVVIWHTYTGDGE